MKKFAPQILIIFLGLLLTDRVGGEVMWWVNQHTQDVTAPKIRQVINDVNEEVLMMGTSRCNSHYVPSIISDSINMSVFNGGVDGANNIYAHYILLNLMIERYSPKMICLDLAPNDFLEQDDPFRTVTFYAPYIGQNNKVDSVFSLAGKKWAYQLSHLFRFNAKATSNLAGLFIDRQEYSERGYMAGEQKTFHPQQMKPEKEGRKVDALKLRFLDKFIQRCDEKNIKLVFVISPKYTEAYTLLYEPIRDIALKRDIPLLDYHTNGLFHDHPEYFRDENHLWDRGARKFSQLFAGSLMRLIEEEYETK